MAPAPARNRAISLCALAALLLLQAPCGAKDDLLDGLKKMSGGAPIAEVKAVAAAPKPLCAPCAAGQELVPLALFVDTEVLDKGWTDMDGAWYRYHRPASIPGDANHDPHIAAGSAAELRRGMLTAVGLDQKRCLRIKYVGVITHGDLGYVHFEEGGLSTTNLSSILEGLDCAMAEDAVIEFGGCNIGRGCRGEDFMAALASVLLKRGGKVRANTNYSSTAVPGAMPHTSLNFDTQILQVDAGPANPRWDNKPQSASACADRAAEALADMYRIKGRLQNGCSISPDLTAALDNTLPWMRAALAGQRDFGDGPRYGFGPEHLKAAGDFYRAFNYYDSLSDKLEKTCAKPPEKPDPAYTIPY